MIEAATGAAFLMASLYGAGHVNAEINEAFPAQPAPISRTLTDAKKVEAFLKREFSDAPILVEIARCESTFRQYGPDGRVIRGLVNSADVGVMQINEKYHAEDAVKLGVDIYSIEGNIAYAKHLYDKFGTSPWASSKACWGTPKDLAQK